MVRTYRAHKQVSRHKTYRGGTVETVKQIIKDTPFPEGSIHIINPNSKFIVATYWWGKENLNSNTQQPCPEDVGDMIVEEVETFAKTKGIQFNTMIMKQLEKLKKLRSESAVLTESQIITLNDFGKRHSKWKKEVLMKHPDLQEDIKRIDKEVKDREMAKPTFRAKSSWIETIKKWEESCRAANVNYVQLNTEFERSDYQNAINGKPLFIKKILDIVKDRGFGVLYIDGDMTINKYPHIFDMGNVDFMARGWNVDPRSSIGALAKPYYDPYIFETSGGTMYFGNTQRSRELLDRWENTSAKPESKGKADDRILSQIITVDSLTVNTNIISLPIEYLWLTDNYRDYLTDASRPASVEDAYIEHPLCLTGEERAKSQSASNVDRTPVGYEEQVTGVINYERPPELFYEYIFFDGNQQACDGYKRYDTFMTTATNYVTGQPMLTIIPLSKQYGPYNTIASENLKNVLPSHSVPQRTGILTRKRNVGAPPVPGTTGKVSLPMNAPIPEILKALYNGNDVELGGTVSHVQPEDEVAGYSASVTPINEYLRTVKIDLDFPLFISHKSKVFWHALAMCRTLSDINIHIEGSYMFMSRIRWNLKNISAPQKLPQFTLPDEKPTGFVPRVNQIWFGGEIPKWREYMFNENKKICESYGFRYSLWKNEDRTKENFPQTFDYQNTALEKGKEIGQNRWAQVADLARLEIIHNVGGIYIDSLIEITPAFLKAISDAFVAGNLFVGCNEDPCEPLTDCKGYQDKLYLSNSFFAAVPESPILARLIAYERLDQIDFDSEYINRTTGPYYLREGIQDPTTDKVFMFNSDQIFPFNNQPTPYKEEAIRDRFLSKTYKPGSLKVNSTMFYMPGGAEVLQSEFLIKNKGPLAIYHSGLGGTWST